MVNMKKTVLGAALVMAFGATAAQAAYTPTVSTTGNNFSMVGGTNGTTGGNNNTVFTWDETWKTAVVTDGSSNATLSSVSKFGGYLWTAHNVNVYGVGSYTFQTDCQSGNPSAGCALKDPINGTNPANVTYTMTVGAGQVGAHMLFDWGATNTGTTACGKANCNIDVVVLWDMNKSWAQTGTTSTFSTMNQLALPAVANTVTTVWSGVSIDTGMDADTYSGTKMVDGAFIGQSANFNVKGVYAQPVPQIPVPAAAWLLGSGLLGLIGVARRKAA